MRLYCAIELSKLYSRNARQTDHREILSTNADHFLLFHLSERLLDSKLGSRLLLDLINTNAWCHFRQSQTTSLPVDFEHTLSSVSFAFHINMLNFTYQIRNNSADTVRACQRQSAVLHNLRRAIFVDMVR